MGFCMTTCEEAKQMRTGITITATIRDKGEPRTVNTKYGETQVCDCFLEDDTGGIGLGITIAADIINNHGGNFLLEQSPLGGLRAKIYLPI